MLIVDPLTGAMWRLDKDYVYEKLERSKDNKNSNASLSIFDINNISSEMKEHLVKIK